MSYCVSTIDDDAQLRYSYRLYPTHGQQAEGDLLVKPDRPARTVPREKLGP